VKKRNEVCGVSPFAVSYTSSVLNARFLPGADGLYDEAATDLTCRMIKNPWTLIQKWISPRIFLSSGGGPFGTTISRQLPLTSLRRVTEASQNRTEAAQEVSLRAHICW